MIPPRQLRFPTGYLKVREINHIPPSCFTVWGMDKISISREWIVYDCKFSEELICNKTKQASVQVCQPSRRLIHIHSRARITGHHTANQVIECVCVLSSDTQTHIPTCTNQPKAMLGFIADKLHIDFSVDGGLGNRLSWWIDYWVFSLKWWSNSCCSSPRTQDVCWHLSACSTFNNI